ncbi:cobalamin B12-binding domain-containing protein [Methylobacterium crusticola]|uniref:cobalamin B12-binding domain-containing protein n=1 Tax=Methylobacterium crusticola TaxID=1697972 RepID=UPI001EE2CE12|nr:cobalamin B12-binding domain-containing protein [Methylobacterium crusticola]
MDHAPAAQAGDPRWRDDLARVVEAEIIPRLMLAHGGGAPQRRPTRHRPEPEDVVRFSSLILADQETDPAAEVRAMLEEGLSLESLLLDLMAPTARHLGLLWEQDICDFVQVTVAMGRLRRMVHGLESLCGEPAEACPSSRRILLMPAPGEAHTFGLTIVDRFFREAGWEVVSSLGQEDFDPLRRVRDEWFDVAGFSLSDEGRLGTLGETIPEMRRASCNQALRLLVGGPAFHERPDRLRLVGADAAVTDARAAPGIAENLLDLRVRAC